MKMIRAHSVKKNKPPFILLDRTTELSVEDFLNLTDSIAWFAYEKPGDPALSDYREKATNGILEVRTGHYNDSVRQTTRRTYLTQYRKNEMECFFGKGSPLILFGNQEISRETYETLPEDTVAFVNFYLNDFVKDFYAPQGKQGIVYVCPRKQRSKIKYMENLPLPANGRNYMDGFPTTTYGTFRDGGYNSHFGYINTKKKEYLDEIDKGMNATVITSCVIHTDGIIEPILTERIDSERELTREQKEKLIRIANEIIRSMPPWEPGQELLYDKSIHKYVGGTREVSRSISICLRRE